ncbi:MAG TPA: outer membrane lipoprotein-sorting protein [Candidatus Saccharimonadales bacterium]|jgi:outer membrane lipoprotein-sorting protein|nr:outer membrane lipoprotein-sorting protein [Candidatus Saccharimonadales bacterium]
MNNPFAGIWPQKREKLVKVAALTAAACLFSALCAFAQNDARGIMARVYVQDTSHDLKLRATLDITDKDGHSVKKKFLLSRIGSFGNGKILLRFTDPAELRGVKLLSINQPGTPDQQWIYTPATERVRSITPRERSEHFAGSDFTYEDIAEHPLDNFTYQLLPAEDVIENHKTFKIMATPASSGDSQYKFIYYWVAQDVPCILHAEMYDQDGRKVREMHASSLRKESGIWGARKTEMRSLLDGTRSVLTIDEAHFNTGLDSAMFTPESLEKNE